MGVVEDIAGGLQSSLLEMANKIIQALPNLIVATVILVIGYYISKYVGRLIGKILKQIGLEKKLDALGLKKALAGTDLSHIIAELSRWYIFLVFLQEAAAKVTLGAISDFIGSIITIAPSLFAAVIILIIGLLVAEFISDFIKKVRLKEADYIAVGAKIFILYLALVMALSQIGIETEILTNLFTVIVAAVGLGIALAIGIAFGLGGQKRAAEIWKKLRVRSGRR